MCNLFHCAIFLVYNKKLKIELLLKVGTMIQITNIGTCKSVGSLTLPEVLLMIPDKLFLVRIFNTSEFFTGHKMERSRGAGVCFCLWVGVTVCDGKKKRTAKGCTKRKAAIPTERIVGLWAMANSGERNEAEMK